MSMMRVITQDRFGGPEVLYPARRPVPRPGPTEIRVRVHAAGVNPVDQGTRAGGGMSDVVGRPPFVLGWEASGVVDEVAPGVTRFAVGDEVFGLARFPHEVGAYAEFLTAPSRHFAAKPAAIDHRHAGALPLAGLTAWQALVDTAKVQAGQRVLVHAAEARGVRATSILVEPDHAGLDRLAALVDAGRLRVVLHESLPLERAAKAHEIGELRRTAGKLVLTV